MKKELTQERLKEVLRYYPITGNFRWIKQIGSQGALGTIAGYYSPGSNYIFIGIDGDLYRAHRLAFLYMTGKFPKDKVDHEDHNRSNNSWRNLSNATAKSNKKNMSRYKNNTSGCSGVYWAKDISRWRPYISLNSKRIYFGCFTIKKDAIKARKKAEKKYGFHNNHGKRKRVQLVGVN